MEALANNKKKLSQTRRLTPEAVFWPHTHRHIDTYTHRQTKTDTDRHRHIDTYTHSQTQTDTETDKQTHTDT